MLAVKGGYEIKTADDFDNIMSQLDSDPQMLEQSGRSAGEYVGKLSGATRKILSSINSKANERLA